MKIGVSRVIPHEHRHLTGNFLVVGHIDNRTGKRTLPCKSTNKNYIEKMKEEMEYSGGIEAKNIHYTSEQIEDNRGYYLQPRRMTTEEFDNKSKVRAEVCTESLIAQLKNTFNRLWK